MEIKELCEKLNNYKPGTFVKVCWEKDIATKKAKKSGISIVKHYEALCRVAINYHNIKAVKSSLKSVDGLPNKDSNHSSKHSSWYTHSDVKGIVHHKEDESKKYLQIFPVKNQKIKTHVTINVESEGLNKLYELGLITKKGLDYSGKSYSTSKDNNNNEDKVSVKTISVENIVKFGI